MEKIMTPQEVYAESIKNRKMFLAPYQDKFRKAKDEKANAKIISKLIEIEPSHLSEPWIIKQVIEWLRDRDEFADFIEDTFIRAPKKNTATKKQQEKYVQDYYLIKQIDRIRREKSLSIDKACREYMDWIIQRMEQFRDSGCDEDETRYFLSWDLMDITNRGSLERSAPAVSAIPDMP
jgi:hypothetical protein